MRRAGCKCDVASARPASRWGESPTGSVDQDVISSVVVSKWTLHGDFRAVDKFTKGRRAAPGGEDNLVHSTALSGAPFATYDACGSSGRVQAGLPAMKILGIAFHITFCLIIEIH